jgi:hypothetical protein
MTTNFSPVSQPTFPVLAVRHRRIWVNIPSSRSRHITPARHFHGLGTLSGVGSAPAQLIQQPAQRHARQGRHDDCAEIQELQPRGSNKDYLAAFDYFARISTVLGAGGGGRDEMMGITRSTTRGAVAAEGIGPHCLEEA